VMAVGGHGLEPPCPRYRDGVSHAPTLGRLGK